MRWDGSFVCLCLLTACYHVVHKMFGKGPRRGRSWSDSGALSWQHFFPIFSLLLDLLRDVLQKAVQSEDLRTQQKGVNWRDSGALGWKLCLSGSGFWLLASESLRVDGMLCGDCGGEGEDREQV